METWAKITAILCMFGILKEIRPSEPFLTEYLEGPWLNFTSAEVNHEIYPIWTYSYVVCLLIVLLVTDFVRYKPVIIIEALSYIITWSLLLWSRTLLGMQMMQAVYGVATSTEVAYFTYIYSVVSENAFQKVTGYARSAILFGRFLSGVISQSFISSQVLDFHSLNYVSFGCVLAAFLTSLFLPHPTKQVLCDQESQMAQKRSLYQSIRDTMCFIKRELKKCYSDRDVLLWCVWWAFATCGNTQVGNYIQPLWETVHSTWGNGNNTPIYNGAIEATHTLLSSLLAMALGLVHFRLLQLNELFLAVFTVLDCILLIIMAWTSNIWIAYVTYILFRSSYQIVITVVSFHVMKRLSPDTYGLVFGTNTFFALILQTLMTVIFVDKRSLNLDPRKQFTVYSIYFGLLGTGFLILGLRKVCCSKSQSNDNLLLENNQNKHKL